MPDLSPPGGAQGHWEAVEEHPRGNFWFVSQLEPGDDGYDPKTPLWKAYLQVPGMVCPIEPAHFSEEGALEFIRDDILGAPLDPS